MGDARLTAEQETMLREAVRRRAGEAPMFAGLVEAVWAELDRVRRSLDEARAQLTAQRNRNDALQELLDVGAKTMEAVNGQLAKEQDEHEQCRVQLAGCGAGALGYADDCKPGDYGWSASLGDVLQLRQRWNEDREQLAAAQAENGRLREALEAIAAPYVIDGKDHRAAVNRARAALADTGKGTT